MRYSPATMRRYLLAIAMIGCASGGRPGSEVDANGGDGNRPVDADTCGEPGQLPCDAVYVAKSGSDSATGGKTAPLKTIAAAIAMAGRLQPTRSVFVQAGTYSETITMSPGVDVYGGFDESWARNPSVTTTIAGGSPAVRFEAITVPTKLDAVSVTSSDGVSFGDSSIGIAITSSQLIELHDVSVSPGIGAAGVDGSPGANGANGTNGTGGQPGCEDSGIGCSSCPRPVGGGGGTSACGRSGGRGGDAGYGGSGGSAGAPGAGPSAGGSGASASRGVGSEGAFGSTGFPGPQGIGGAEVGTFSGTSYVPASGSNGVNGVNGNGGGGGGGGGGGTTNCDSYGSSGGGGGGGGCAGTAGTAGGGGGGSFGVLAVDSDVVIKSSTVTASRGGNGGRGGLGGIGGTGGTGGPGGPYGGNAEQDDGGTGGAGGVGGFGGAGGSGGGGGGGPSAALVCVGTTTITVPQSMLVAGTAGTGGSAPVHAGANGTSANAIGCSFF